MLPLRFVPSVSFHPFRSARSPGVPPAAALGPPATPRKAPCPPVLPVRFRSFCCRPKPAPWQPARPCPHHAARHTTAARTVAARQPMPALCTTPRGSPPARLVDGLHATGCRLVDGLAGCSSIGSVRLVDGLLGHATGWRAAVRLVWFAWSTGCQATPRAAKATPRAARPRHGLARPRHGRPGHATGCQATPRAAMLHAKGCSTPRAARPRHGLAGCSSIGSVRPCSAACTTCRPLSRPCSAGCTTTARHATAGNRATKKARHCCRAFCHAAAWSTG
jgi:hypothetical protein